jgi:hypothetical protein
MFDLRLQRTDEEYIKDTSLDFCKKQNLKSAMVKSIGLLQNSSYDEISQVINDSLSLVWTMTRVMIGRRTLKSASSPSFRNPVSTGWPIIDNICKGGLGQKELGRCYRARLVPANQWCSYTLERKR